MAVRNTGPGKALFHVARGANKRPKAVDLLLYNFDSDTSTLKERHQKALDQIVALLKGAESFVVSKNIRLRVDFVLVGSADKTGDPAKNVELAKSRAASAVQYMKEKWPARLRAVAQQRTSKSFSERGVCFKLTVMPTGWKVLKGKESFQKLKWENIIAQLFGGNRPTKTPGGGYEDDRAVFLRVAIGTEAIKPIKADLDYLINKAYAACGVLAIAEAVAEIGKMHTSETAKFNTRAARARLHREMKHCMLMQVYGDCLSLGGPISKITKKQLSQEIESRYKKWLKR